ncbi:MAG TPA: AMP-binding protein, partial [Rhodocyclaceae bacterium]
MTAAVAGDNFAVACCGRWAADRARFALHCTDAAGRDAGWSFWDVQREANRFSNVLGAAGVMRGDRVALLLPPCAEAAALLVACWQMGATAMPLSPRRSAGELEGAVAEARV